MGCSASRLCVSPTKRPESGGSSEALGSEAKLDRDPGGLVHRDDSSAVVVMHLLKQLNSHLTDRQLMDGLDFNGDGQLRTWDLSGLNIKVLPDTFGGLRLREDL